MCEARRAEYVRLLDEEGMNFTHVCVQLVVAGLVTMIFRV